MPPATAPKRFPSDSPARALSPPRPRVCGGEVLPRGRDRAAARKAATSLRSTLSPAGAGRIERRLACRRELVLVSLEAGADLALNVLLPGAVLRDVILARGCNRAALSRRPSR